MDRAVTAAYEPGSTFKVITMTGAIENRVTNPDALVDCQMGSIQVAGRLIHDWHPFGVLSVRDVLAHSSDVGSIKIALSLGAPRFYDTMRRFGIGQLTGIELPGENRGLLASAGKLDGQFDRVGRDRAGSQRDAGADYFRDFGDREWRHAVSPAHRAGNSRRGAGARCLRAPNRSK